MALQKVLARGWAFEINAGTVAVPVWTEIGGLTTWANGGDEATEADGTDFQSDGWSEHTIAGRSGGTITLDGRFKIDPADGTRDAGQAAVEAAAEEIDYDSLKGFRYFHVASGEGVQGDATFRRGSVGGGNNDNTSWGCTAKFNGQPTPYTVV